MRYLYKTYKTILSLACVLLLGILTLSAQEMNCMDGLDDDGDGLTDCFDLECPSCDFDCEYKVPSSGSGNITLMTSNAGTDPDYIEVFVVIDEAGVIQYMTMATPPTFTGVVPGQYLAIVLVYQSDAGIENLAVGNNINIVSSGCIAMSDSYPFEVCTNAPPTLTNLESDPLCYCAGEAIISETITAADPDMDSLKATVQIVGGYIVGEDILTYTGTIAVPTMFDAATGMLMIGPAPPSVVDFALNNVVYQNTSASGAETAGSRRIAYSVTDGFDTAGPISREVQVGNAACPCQEISAAKNVANVNTMVCDGTGNIHVTYTFAIGNTGGMDLGNISLTENLASQLGAAFVSVIASPVITSSNATTDPTINGGYDGAASTDLFDGMSGVLQPGERLFVDVVVAIDNDLISSTLTNQATVTATAIDAAGNPIVDGVGVPVTTTDLTDNGTDPRTDNGMGETDDSTPLQFPAIGVTKAMTSSVSSIGGAPEDYTVSYELIVENTGTTILEDFTLTDDLSSWGAALLASPAPTVTLMNIDATILPTDNNGSFNGVSDGELLAVSGSGLLNPGESFKVIITVAVDKSAAPLAGLVNSAMTEAVPTDGAGNPIVGLDNPTDTSDDATGLAQGDPACNNPGAANDLGGSDDPTVVTFPPCPVLTKTIPSTPVALPNGNYAVTYDFVIENVGGAQMCNLDLTENFAMELGCAFQDVISTSAINLVNTSGNSTTPTANTSYNGDSNDNLLNTDGCLFPGDVIDLSVTVELDVACEGVDDPLLNSATVCGTDPNTGRKVSDDSDSTTDGGPDDPTPLTIPNIDLTKDQISSTILANGNIQVEYLLTIQNTGNSNLLNVALEDDLATQLSPAFVSAMTVSITGDASILGNLNAGFTGAGTTSSAAVDGDDILDRSGVMQPGEMIVVVIKAEIDPLAVPSTGLTNQATTTAVDPDGTPVTDISDDDVGPGEDDPTPLDLGPIPELEKTLTSAPVALPNGNFELTYAFNLKNNGTEEMCQIDLLDDIDSQFGCAFVSATPATLIAFNNNTGNSISPTFNTAFNGSSFTNMFNGDGCLHPTDSIQWMIRVEVTTDCDPLNSPLANIATVNAEDQDGNGVTDMSDDDTDLDGDGMPDNESGGEDDPTFAYLPNIEITKSLVNQTVLADGNVELVFDFVVENTGNANLSNILVEDPLVFSSALIGTPIVSLSNLTASVPPVDNNGSFNGTSDDDLTVASATDLLQPDESFMISMTAVVDPEIFGLLMPQPVENQATVSGDPVDDNGDPIPGYGPVMDESDDSAEVEPGPDDPTPITITPIPELTKGITATPVELVNGNYSVNYEFIIKNNGGSRFCQIDLLEDFATQYGCAFVDVLSTTSPVLANVSGNSIIPTGNALYNGSSQTNLLNTDGCLYPGDSITITTTIELDPSCTPIDDPLVNQATVNGVDDEDNPVTDDSDDESEFPNDTGGPDDPTLLSIPDIDLAKDLVGMMALPNGNMEVTFQLVIQNTGNTDLTNVALEDDLATQFSPAFVSAMTVSINGTASTLGGLNAGFTGGGTTNSAIVDGDDVLDRTAILKPGEVIVVDIKVEIDPLQVPVTGLTNQATTTGTDPDGDPVTDISDDGTDPTEDTDEPTPLDFGPIPDLEKALVGLPVLLANGNYALTYEYNLKNNGTSEFCQIDVLDDFSTRFGCAFVNANAPNPIAFANNSGSSIQPSLNTGFNGISFVNMYTGDGCIFPGDSIQWSVTVEVTLDCDPVPSPLANIATVNAEDPDGDPVTDDSDDETDLDSNDDPDNETGGEDDPTLAYLPEIEITKELAGSTALPNGNVVLEFKFNIENTGNANLSTISITDPLPFATAVVGTPILTLMNTSATMPPADNNGAYNGGSNINMTIGAATDMLRPAESFMMMLEVEVDPVVFGQLPMPLLNQAMVTGNPVDNNGDPIPGYPPVDDLSDDESDLPGDDDPTPVSIPPTPELMKSIVGTPTELANGNYSVVYNFTIQNLGGSEFCQLDLLEDFATQYGCAFIDILATTPPVLDNLTGNSTNPSLNPLYNGSSQINLLNTDGCLFPGDSITLTATAEIDPSCMPVEQPLMNTATVNGEAPDGSPVTDDSDDESDIPNDTGGPDDPTLLAIPDIDVAKDQLGFTNLPNGNIEVEYQLVIQNTGNTILTNIALEDDIATQFAPAFVNAMGVSISGTANTLGGLNTSFIGSGTTSSVAIDGDDILDRSGVINPGEQIVVVIKVEVDPLLVPVTGLANQATTTGTDPTGDPVEDVSDDGVDPAEDTDEPTPLDLGPIPEIVKTLVAAPTQLANGNYTMDFSFVLKNNGTSEMCQIDILEDLDTQYGCAFVDADPAALVSFGNVSGNSIMPSINTGYNGNSDFNMFTGNGCIFPGDSLEWTISVEVTLDCDPIPSPLANTATVNAEDPEGNPVSDDSDDDTDLDNDDNPDNDTGDEDDPTFTYFPEISITKDLVSVTELPNGNFNMVFDFDIENTGNANLSTINITDPLPFASAVVGTPVLTLTNISSTMPPVDNNGSFDGSGDINMTIGAATDLLQPNESFMMTMEVEVDPTIFGTLPQPVLNQATAMGTPVDENGDPIPGYPPVEDESDDDSDLPGDDDPTPVSIPPVPQLTKAISGLPTALPNGNYAVSYDFIIENLGGSEFCSIDLMEDFATQYDCAFVRLLSTTPPVLVNTSTNSIIPTLNSLYNGSTQTNLLNTDGCLFPGDSITVSVMVEVDISCPTRPEPLANQATVMGEGPNGEEVEDDSDDDTDLNEDDDPDNETGGPDDPTILPIPEITLTKAVIGSIELPNGNYEINFELVVENTGNVDLTNLSLIDSLNFGSTLTATPTVSVMNISASNPPASNTTYDGIVATDLLNGMATDLLTPGQQFKVLLTTEVDFAAFAALMQPVENQATVAGDDPNGNTVEDDSDDESEVRNDTGGPDDPTIIPVPQIKIVKDIIDIQPALTDGNYYVTFELVVKNTGNVDLDSIQVSDDLAAEFGSAYVGLTAGPIVTTSNGTPSIPNAGTFPINVFDGTSGLLKPQDELTIEFTVEVNPDAGGAPTPLENQATATGTGPGGEEVTDVSDDSADPDDPDMDDPTPLSLPQINLAKEITEVVPAASGTTNHFDVNYRFVIQNTGNVPLDSLTLIDDLASDLGAAFVRVVALPSIYTPLTTATTTPIINPLFIGTTPALDMLFGMSTAMLLPRETVAIDVIVELNPSAAGADSPLMNQATASGKDPNNIPVEDDSDNGADPDGTNDEGGPDDPTPLDCTPAKMAITPDALTICEGENVSLSVTSDIAWATYKWENLNQSGVLASTEQNPTFTDIPVTTNFAVSICPTDGACWTGLTDTITITVIPTATAPIVENKEVCEGDLIQLSTTRVGVDLYNWTGPNGFSSSDQNPFVSNAATATDAGIYQLITRVEDCPSEPAFATVVVVEIPDAPTLQMNGPICQGDSIILSTSAICDSYQWIGPDGSSTSTLSNPLLTTLVNTTTIPPTDSAYDAGIWTVICINGNGCVSEPSDAVVQVINAIPDTPTPNYSGAVCEGNVITLLPGGTYDETITYAWYTVDPEIDLRAEPFSTTAAPIISDLIAGNYDYWLVVSNNNCVSASASVRVIINKLPNLTVDNDGRECVTPMTDITLSANPSGGITPFEYQWTGPNGFSAIAQEAILPNATNDQSGNYVVVLTDANGCTAEAITTIDITIAPDEPFLDGNGPLCFGESFFLSAMPSYTGVDVHYEWSGPRGTTTGGAYPDAPNLMIDTISLADVGTYNLQVSIDGCSSLISQPYILTVITPPNAPIVEDVAICLGDLLQIGTETTADSYVWTGPNGFTSTDQNPFVSANASITDVGLYEVQIVQGNCISEAAVVNVSINSLEESPTLQINAPICEGEDLILQTSATCDMYIWVGPEGSSTTTLSNPLLVTTTNTTTIPFGDVAYDAGVWTLICQNGEGCNSAASEPVEVVIHPIPDAPLPTNNGPVCLGEDILLSAGADYPEGTTFQWYNSDPATGGLIISNEQNPTFSNFTAPGNFFYWLTVTTDNCTSPAGITLAVIRELPTVTASNNGTECVNPTTDLIINSVPAGGAAPYTYAWTGPNDFASIEQNPVLPNAGDDLSGSYIVVITDANGCTATAETIIDVTANPNRPNLVYSGASCEGTSTTISIQEFEGVAVNYTWFKDGVALANIGNQLILNPVTTMDIGNYHVLVEVDDCTTISDTLLVEVYEQPTASIAMVTNQDCVVGIEELMLVALPEGGSSVYTYNWAGPNGFTSTDSIATLINIDASTSGTYTLEVTDDNGCLAAVASQTVDITDGIVEPTINISDLSCEGGEVKLSIPSYSGSNVSYTWTTPTTVDIAGLNTNELIINPIQDSIHVGGYSVLVSVDGCEVLSDTFELNLLPSPTVNLTSNEGTICPGGILSLFANAEGALEYQWSGPNGFTSSLANPLKYEVTNTDNGLYGVTVTNSSGCTAFGSVDIATIQEESVLPTIISNSPICEGDSIILIAGGEGTNFEWIGPLGSLDTLAAAQYIIDFDIDVPTITFITDQLAEVQGNILMNDGSGADTGFDYTIQITVTGGPDGTSIINFPDTSALAVTTIDQGPTNIGMSGGQTALRFSVEGRVGSDQIEYRRDPSSKLNFKFQINTGEKIENFTYEIGDIDYSFESSSSGSECFETGEPNDYNCQFSFIDRITFLTDIASNEYTVIDATEVFQVNEGQFYARFPDANDNQRPDFADNGGINSTDPSGNIRVFNPNAVTSIEFFYDDPGYGIEGDADGYHDFDSANTLVSLLSGMTFDIAKIQQGDTLVIAPDDPNYLPGEWRVKVTGANCCRSISDPIQVEINEIPEAPLPRNSSPVCTGEEVQLWSGADYPEGTVFNWYDTDPTLGGSPINNETNPTFNNLVDAGDYTFWLSVTVNGCTSLAGSTTVTINEPPTATIALVADQACVEGSEELQLISLPIGGQTPYTYIWSGPSDFTSTDSIATLINIDASMSGTYQLEVVDANGCIAAITSQTVDVTNGIFEPIIAISDLSCEGGTVKLSIPAYSGSNIIYTWSTPTTTNVTGLNTNEIIVSPMDSTIHQGNYSVTVEVDDCIIQSDTFLLQTLPAPTIAPSILSGTLCTGEVLELFANATDAVQYNWAGPAGFVSSLPNPTISSVSVANNGQYAVTVTNFSGCSAVGFVSVNSILESKPTASIVSNSPICDGEDIVLSSSTEGVLYEWIGPLGASEQTLSTHAGLATPFNSTTLSVGSDAYLAGNYSVLVTDANGCTAISEEIEIVINAISTMPLPTNDGAVCIGTEVQLSAGGNYPVRTIYNWHASDPSIVGATVFSNEENPIINNITIDGAYTYWLNVEIDGCVSPAGQTTIFVNEAPSVSASNTGTECVDPMTDLGLIATPSGGTAPYSYTWTGPSGFSSINQNPTLPNAEDILTGTYIVQITDANGCTATAETVIDVTGNPNRPNLQYTGSVCEGERIELNIQEFAGVSVSYNWFKNGAAITNISNLLILNPATTEDNGNYWVQVEVDGCTTISDTLLLEVYEEPSVNISAVIAQACVAGQGELNLIAFPQDGVAPYKYKWSGPNNFISADSVATIVNITSAATGIYTLVVTDANGCESILATQELDITDDFLEPQIDINNVACAGKEIILEVPTYEGNSVTYTWSTPNNVETNITGLNTNTIIVNPVDTLIHQGNYSVEIDIDGCVIASDTFNLETLSAPTVDPIILTQGLCTGEILSLSANATNAVSYDWSGPAGFSSDLPEPSLIEVTIANNGQYGVTVTNSSGCTAVGFVEVNVINPPREIPSFVTNSPICNGEDLILSSSSEGITFEWVGPLGGSDQTFITFPNLITSEGNTIINMDNPAYLAGEWIVRVIDTNGCTISSDPIEVVINPIPRALAFNNGPSCQGASIELVAGEVENAIYEWRVVGDPTIISTSRTPVFDNIQTTTLYELTILAEGCVGQTDTTEVVIWQPPILTPSTIYDLNADCAASDVQLLANVIEGSAAAVSYSWTGPNDFVSTLANPTIPNASELVNGTYTLEVVDANGCTASGATEILNVINIQNAPFILPSGPSCEGGKITLSVPAYSGSNIVYTWFKDTVAIPNVNSHTLIFDPVSLDDEATYFVQIVVDGCTITSAPYVLEIYESPVASIAPVTPLSCVTGSEEVSLNATIEGGLAPYQYEWSGPNNFSASIEDPVLINVDASKSGIYTLNVIDANGCSALAASVNVDITEGNHEPIITASAPTCEGGSVTISTKEEWASAVDFQWTRDGQILTDINTNTFTIFPVTTADAGIYQVQITVDGCTNISDTYNLEIYTAPTLTISNNGMECVEAMDDLQLFATPNGNPAGLTYEWSGPNGFASSAQNPFLPNATDEYSGEYTVVVGNINGCENSFSTTVDISRIPDKPTISAEGDICSGTLLKLNAPLYNGIAVDYEWTGPFGSTTSGAYPNSPSLTLSPATTALNGLYMVSVTINGCASLLSEPYVVNIDAPPVVQITSGNINCAAPTSTLTLNTTVTGGVGPYEFEWTGPNGFTATAASPVLANLSNEDAGTYTVMVTDASGCQSQVASQFIAISTPPVTPEIQLVTPNVCEGETVILSADNYTGASVAYYWSVEGTSTILDTTAGPSLILQNISSDYTGIVTVRVMVDGCVSSISSAKELIVNPQPAAPELAASFVVCEGDNLQLSTPTIADSYKWSGPNGFVSSVQSPAIINNITEQGAGLYALVSIINGCESEPSFTTVVLNPRPIQPTLQVVADICDGDLLVMQVQTPQQGVTYQWIPPGMTLGQFPEDRASFTEPVLWTDDPFLTISKNDFFHLYQGGAWRVRLVNSIGCTSEVSLSQLINIHDVPELPLITNTGPVCEGELVQIMASPVPGATYSWFREIILPDGTATYELVSNGQRYETFDLPMGSHLFFLTVERNGCSISSLPGLDGGSENEGISTEVIINEMPVVTLPEISGNYCEGDIVQLDAPSIPGATYAWTGPNGYISFLEDPTIFNMTASSSGVYSLVVTKNGCEAAAVTTQILIGSQPMTPTISYDGSTCEGEEIRLMVSNIANGNFVRYEWRGPNGFFASTQDLVIPSAAQINEGDYTVKVFVNGCGSLSSSPTTVLVNAIPAAPSIAANGSTDAPLCEGEPILLETDFDPELSYRWVGPAGFSSNIHNPLISNSTMLQAGTYSLSVVRDGCASAISSLEVGIQGSPSQPFAANTGPVCAGNDLLLYIANPVKGNTYEWFKQEGNEFVGSGESLTLSNVDIRDAGSYYVLASVGDCTSDAYTGVGIVEQVFTSVEVENPTKELANTTGTLFACEDEVNLTATTPQFTSGFWTAIDTDARIIDPNNPKSLVTNLQSGTNTFVWSLETDNCGVTSSDTLSVSHNVVPIVNEDFYNIGINEIQDINLLENDFIQSTDATVTILTDLQLGRAIPNGLGAYTYVPNENAVGVESFTYQICQKECPDLCAEAIGTIVVGENVDCFAGEFVTPNNDGFNDTFIVPCLANHPNSSLSIYNRYGDEIFFSDNYQNDWEGTYNGAILPAGTYYYILRVNDTAGTMLSGYIFLQR